MTNFLEGYEPVAERIEKFWLLYPTGRISTILITDEPTRFVVRCDLYREADDLIPFANDYAEEIRSSSGVNRTSALENCVTSAIGRACHTGGISKYSEGVPRPSFEEMRHLSVVQDAPRNDPWTGKEIIEEIAVALAGQVFNPDAPTCQHGSMIRKDGVNGKGHPYAGWVCISKDRGFQCPAKWDIK